MDNGTLIVGGVEVPATKDLSATVQLPTIIERVADGLLLKAQSLTIVTDEDYIKAGAFGSQAGMEWDRLEAERVKMKAPFLSGGKGVDEHYRLALANLDKAVKQVKATMTAYNDKKRLAAAAEQKRLNDERVAREAEAKRLEEAALEKIRAEERARVAAAEAQAAEERRKREAAEAEARRADEERQAAEARAAGDRAAAEAADQRARNATAQAEQAKQDAAKEREKAIEAKRQQLRAERETAAAVQTMETATAASSTATQTALAGPGLARVAGANDRITIVWKWRLRAGQDAKVMIQEKKINWLYLQIDEAKVQSVVDKCKDKELAEHLLGGGFEVYSEETIALKKGSKT